MKQQQNQTKQAGKKNPRIITAGCL